MQVSHDNTLTIKAVQYIYKSSLLISDGTYNKPPIAATVECSFIATFNWCDKINKVVQQTWNLVAKDAAFADTLAHKKPAHDLDANNGIDTNIL